MISNVNSWAIVTSSICEPLAIVTSHWSIILTLYLWRLSSPQWRCQPGRFSMAAHRHDRRGIYRCVLLRFCGRIEIDHSYGLRCRGLCCHSWHSTRGAGLRGLKRPRDGRLHLCCTGSRSTNHSSADRIVVNSYNILKPVQNNHCDWRHFQIFCIIWYNCITTLISLKFAIYTNGDHGDTTCQSMLSISP